jgi:hypothetical protein
MKTGNLHVPHWTKWLFRLIGTPSRPVQQAVQNKQSAHAAQTRSARWQRVAFRGNYFAGPTCVFDPRLL